MERRKPVRGRFEGTNEHLEARSAARQEAQLRGETIAAATFITAPPSTGSRACSGTDGCERLSKRTNATIQTVPAGPCLSEFSRLVEE